MNFIMIGHDKPNGLELRKATRPAHLEWMATHGEKAKLGGPMLGTDGAPIASVIFLEATDQAAAEALYAQDPYRKAGLFERWEIRPFNVVVGGFK